MAIPPFTLPGTDHHTRLDFWLLLTKVLALTPESTLASRPFSFLNLSSSISSSSSTPQVSRTKVKLAVPKMPVAVKRMKQSMPARERAPMRRGMVVEATVPNTDMMPTPMDRAREGKSSLEQTPMIANSPDMQKRNTKMKASCTQTSGQEVPQSSGTLRKRRRALMAVAMPKLTMQACLRLSLSMRKKRGVQVSRSETLRMRLEVQMSKPNLSTISVGPQYITQVATQNTHPQTSGTRSEGNRQMSRGVITPECSSTSCCSITCSMSSTRTSPSTPLLSRPMRFSCRAAKVAPERTRNMGVSTRKRTRRSQVRSMGRATAQRVVVHQSRVRQQMSVMKRAPKVKAPWMPAISFCRNVSSYTSDMTISEMLRMLSVPRPSRKLPPAAITMFWAASSTPTPTSPIDHAPIIVFFRPQLSAKKEVTEQPTSAPAQTEVAARLRQTSSSQKKVSPRELARERISPSWSTYCSHWSQGSWQTYSWQLLVSSPLPSQSKEGLRKRKAVDIITMPVTYHITEKVSVMMFWYLPSTPTSSIRSQKVEGRASSGAQADMRSWSELRGWLSDIGSKWLQGGQLIVRPHHAFYEDNDTHNNQSEQLAMLWLGWSVGLDATGAILAEHAHYALVGHCSFLLAMVVQDDHLQPSTVPLAQV